MLRSVRLRRALLISTAVVFAAIDLVHKTLDPAEFHHARTPFIAVAMSALIAALGAGIACGGTLGNLVSLTSWADGVPDPFVVAGVAHGVAFNLADLFAVAGDALLLSAAVLYGVRHRERLRERI